MSVNDYEAMFSKLSNHALMIFPTDVERVRRFVTGLQPSIRSGMARELEMDIEYQLVVKIARRIEGYRQRARPDALALDVIITGIISVCGKDVSVLFDPGSTYSYVSSMFARFLVIYPETLGFLIHVSTLVGDSVVVDRIYQSCMVTFCGFETSANLLLLDMIDFEVILGMDWLSPYHAVLDCHAKTVSLAMPGLLRLEWKGSIVDTPSRVISFQKAQRMVDKGCLAYLAYVRDTTTESLTIDSVLVVRDFADVFPCDLPGMPPDRDIDFCIDLATGEGIKVDPKKIEAVQSWSRPTSMTEIRSFLGLAGYYRRFVQGFSSIASPLTRLTQKGDPFRWSDDCEESFQKLKTTLTMAPDLVLPSGSGMYTLKVHEKNYHVHDLELAAIVHVLKI
ncbi:uncharacterized protein [Nicotiana sylvestris]|uniref:uncharacterized protein n=1 Tax=Nicotiana sylvestris TaxID=4096 RepID=UPI00388C8A2C